MHIYVYDLEFYCWSNKMFKYEEPVRIQISQKQNVGWFLETQEWSLDDLKAQSLMGRTPSIFCLGVSSPKTQITGSEDM